MLERGRDRLRWLDRLGELREKAESASTRLSEARTAHDGARDDRRRLADAESAAALGELLLALDTAEERLAEARAELEAAGRQVAKATDRQTLELRSLARELRSLDRAADSARSRLDEVAVTFARVEAAEVARHRPRRRHGPVVERQRRQRRRARRRRT